MIEEFEWLWGRLCSLSFYIIVAVFDRWQFERYITYFRENIIDLKITVVFSFESLIFDET